jgi:hypothetical protein
MEATEPSLKRRPIECGSYHLVGLTECDASLAGEVHNDERDGSSCR